MAVTAIAAAPADFKTYQDRKMKDEKTSDGFTQFPNAVIDNFLKEINLVSELKVTIVIIRKTIGFQKKTDIISTSQFEEITGLAHQSVIDGLRAALERGIVYREKIGQYWSYGLKLVQPLDTFENESSPAARQEVVQPLDTFSQKVVQPLDTQKKGLNKLLNKDKTTPEGVEETKPPPPPQSSSFQVTEISEPGPGIGTEPSSQKVEVLQTLEAIQPVPAPPSKPASRKRVGVKSREPTADPNKSHPAVMIFQETFERLPDKLQRAQLVKVIKDDPASLEEWRKALVYWGMHGRWDKTNVAGMIDCYQKRSYEREQQQPGRPYLGGNSGQQQLEQRPAYSRPARPIKPVGTGPGGRLTEAELSEGYQS